MNRHPATYTAYPRGSTGTFSISPHRFQSRHSARWRRQQGVKYGLTAVAFVIAFLIFNSFREIFSFHSSPETFPVETIRYYDLSDVQGTARGWEREERVLLCTPLRDAESHLRMFFTHLRNFTYPHRMVDLAFLVSDSKDNTMGLLNELLTAVQDDPDPNMPFGEISVIGKDFGQKVNQDVESRHGFAAQAGRRKLMAQARNWLLSAALRPYHSWVYWRDADVETCPFTILEDLMRHNKDVIVPNVWRPLPDWLGGEQPYDLNSWQESETALALADTLDEDAVIVEGYAEYATWRPHLAYLRDPYGDPDMEMDLDGVGGVSILAKAKVFRSGVHFPAFSFEKHAETEGFGKMARRMHFSVTGLPHYTIWHLYEPSIEDIRHMEEMEAERKAREAEEKERAERMKKIKEEFKDTNTQWEKDKNDIENMALKEKEEKQAEKDAERSKGLSQEDREKLTELADQKTRQKKEKLTNDRALKVEDPEEVEGEEEEEDVEEGINRKTSSTKKDTETESDQEGPLRVKQGNTGKDASVPKENDRTAQVSKNKYSKKEPVDEEPIPEAKSRHKAAAADSDRDV